MGGQHEGNPPPLILLVPYPAQGHITPMLRLAHLLHTHGFRSILATPDFIHRNLTSTHNTADSPISFLSIPSGLSTADDTSRDFAAINRAMEDHMPANFESLLQGLGGVKMVVVDLLASWAIGVAVRCGVPVVGFWPAMMATYSLIFAIPDLIQKGFITNFGIPVQEQGLPIPGHGNITTKDLPWLIGDSNTQKSRFTFWLKVLVRSKTLQYLFINSFPNESSEMVPPAQPGPKLIPVGPLLNHATQPSPTLWAEDTTCISWLEAQRPKSAIYVSFGSWVGRIGSDELAELAVGLESTHRPFIWVLPDTWRDALPRGFLDRVGTNGRGKVVAWAPQEAVLSHVAVGCYINHCGWNSTMEAIRCGQKMLCYPISGDQFVNAKYIVDVWEVGLMLGGVERRALREGVWRLMEGEEGKGIEDRVVELRKRLLGSEGVSKVESLLHMCLKETLQNICCIDIL